ELRLDGEQLERGRRWAVAHGWAPYVTPCMRLSTGFPSAGVEISVRSHIKATQLPNPQGEVTFEIMPAWSVLIHVNCGLPGGLIVGSVCMEPTSATNYIYANLHCYRAPADRLNHLGLLFIHHRGRLEPGCDPLHEPPAELNYLDVVDNGTRQDTPTPGTQAQHGPGALHFALLTNVQSDLGHIYQLDLEQ
ncbi:unnamed protein product, partial [Prorocentrum cordatum]